MSDQFRQLVESIVRDVLSTLAPAKPANDEYLSTARAAEVASVSVGTIRRWVRQKHLTKHVAQNRVRIRRTELERYLTGSPKNESPSEKAKRRHG